MSQPLDPRTKSNTCIVLVPSSFCPAETWSCLTYQLTANDFDTVVSCSLPSVSPKSKPRNPPARLEDDAASVRDTLETQLRQGKDVVLVMCSYAGFPGTEAIKDLPSRLVTREEGRSSAGAVVGVIYFNSYLPFPGDSVRSIMGDYLFEPLKSGNPGGYMELPAQAAPAIFSDLASQGKTDEMNEWFNMMQLQSSDAFDGQITHDMWTESENEFKGKVVYVLGEQDMAVPPILGEKMIEKVETKCGKKVKIYRIPGGSHAMAMTRPDNYGNTSAASIPLALDEAIRSGKVKSGNTIATAGFGAGLTWGSAIMRWG